MNKFFQWFEGLCPPFPAQRADKPPTHFFRFLAHYARPFLPLLAVSALLSALIAIIEIYLFSFVGNLVDWLSESQPATFWQTHRSHLIVIASLVLVVLPILKLFYETVVHQGIFGNFPMRIRWQAHRYLLRQSIRFFQDDFAGRIATKMMQTSLGVRDVIVTFTEVMLYVMVYFSGALVLFAMSDLRLTAPMVAWLVGYLYVAYYFIPKLRDISMEQADARSMVTGRVVDSYTNIATVKMFASTSHEDRYARDGMEVFLDTVYRQMRLVTKLSVSLACLNLLLLFSITATSVYLWNLGAVSTGAIAFAVGLVLRLQGMSQWILWEIAEMFENIGVVQDGVGILSRDVEITDAKSARDLAIRSGEIRFENVHFHYGAQISSAKRPQVGGVISGMSLEVGGGEKIGLVGRSGAGKSTLVNLLLRFYDLERGAILIDGQDICRVPQHSLRAHIGTVTQDTSLLHRSVHDNIAYGSETSDLDAVIRAAKKARAHEFILELKDANGRKGYDAHVGERGVKLSGGQRQRIAIARVLLKNAPILILDEATSALDSEVEAAIQEGLYDLMQGKTVIAIAHRLSTIAAMDRLVVMDGGKISEQGSHAELLQNGGLYAELWARQSGGFLVYETPLSKPPTLPTGSHG